MSPSCIFCDFIQVGFKFRKCLQAEDTRCGPKMTRMANGCEILLSLKFVSVLSFLMFDFMLRESTAFKPLAPSVANFYDCTQSLC